MNHHVFSKAIMPFYSPFTVELLQLELKIKNLRLDSPLLVLGSNQIFSNELIEHGILHTLVGHLPS
jgi:hypothetical protein